MCISDREQLLNHSHHLRIQSRDLARGSDCIWSSRARCRFNQRLFWGIAVVRTEPGLRWQVASSGKTIDNPLSIDNFVGPDASLEKRGIEFLRRDAYRV